jgi:hypothetical protein
LGPGTVVGAAPFGAVDVSAARGLGPAFNALGLCGVFQQYNANATHTAAKRIAKRLCSASIDGGL